MSPRARMMLLAILLPPAAVGLRRGAGPEFFTCVVLTLCLYLPGAVYAVLDLRKPMRPV